jgi:hypothetical protein
MIVHETARRTRDRVQSIEKCPVEAGDGAEVPVFRGREVDLGKEHVLRPESQVQSAEADEALEKKGCAHDEHHRERELRDDQGPSQSRPGTALLQSKLKVRPRHLNPGARPKRIGQSETASANASTGGSNRSPEPGNSLRAQADEKLTPR